MPRLSSTVPLISMRVKNIDTCDDRLSDRSGDNDHQVYDWNHVVFCMCTSATEHYGATTNSWLQFYASPNPGPRPSRGLEQCWYDHVICLVSQRRLGHHWRRADIFGWGTLRMSSVACIVLKLKHPSCRKGHLALEASERTRVSRLAYFCRRVFALASYHTPYTYRWVHCLKG